MTEHATIVSRSTRSDSATRVAFTLLELLLTLAILTAIAAVVIPNLGSLLGDSELKRAARLVQIEMMKARTKAMRDGKTQMLEVSPESPDFQIREFVSLANATEANDVMLGTSALLTGADQAIMTTMEAADPPTQISLPENTVFGAVTVASSQRANVELAGSGTSVAAMPVDGGIGETATPILFYPDGTTSTAAVEVKHTDFGSRIIKLRGITGEVTLHIGVGAVQ